MGLGEEGGMGGPRGSRTDSAARRDTRKVRDDRRARGAARRGRALCGREALAGLRARERVGPREVGRGVRLVGPSAEELGCGMGRCGAWAKLGRVWAGGLPGWGLGWVVLGLSFLPLSFSFPF